MGNDRGFIEADDLPFRLIEIPTGSAPPLSLSPDRMSTKRHAPPIPPSRVDGYDAPPSLLPPPNPPKRQDEPLLSVIPQQIDRPQPHSIKHRSYRRKIRKPKKLTCCVIS